MKISDDGLMGNNHYKEYTLKIQLIMDILSSNLQKKYCALSNANVNFNSKRAITLI